ncbi:HNH endonuclease, partial [Acinetobacter baumannii]|nr:HNH endonuclease [Acinetobacter baumannii]
LEPHHLDGDHSNHTAENIVAVCTLCHAQNHIFALSLEKKAEICVLSTNIPQEIFNQYQRALLVLSHK